jgi:hypothetical protein
LRHGSICVPHAISAWSTAGALRPPNIPKSSPGRFPKAMSVLNGRMGITNRQLGSERLIPLIAGVRKGLPARGPQRGCIGLKHR